MVGVMALVNIDIATFSLPKRSYEFNYLEERRAMYNNLEKHREVYTPPIDLEYFTVKTRIIEPHIGTLDLPLFMGCLLFCLGGCIIHVSELILGMRSIIFASYVLLIISGIVWLLSFSRRYLTISSPVGCRFYQYKFASPSNFLST